MVSGKPDKAESGSAESTGKYPEVHKIVNMCHDDSSWCDTGIDNFVKQRKGARVLGIVRDVVNECAKSKDEKSCLLTKAKQYQAMMNREANEDKRQQSFIYVGIGAGVFVVLIIAVLVYIFFGRGSSGASGKKSMSRKSKGSRSKSRKSKASRKSKSKSKK